MWTLRERKLVNGPVSFVVSDHTGILFDVSPFPTAGYAGLKAIQKAVAAPLLLDACKDVVPCLEDWIQTTGHGEVNRRDRDALSNIGYAIREAERDPLKTHDEPTERASVETPAQRMLKALKMLRGQYVSFVRVTTGRDTEKDGNPYIAEVDAVIAEAERES